MINNYEVAEVMEVGKAHDVILGGQKFFHVLDDSPIQERRDPEEMQDDE